MHFVMSLWSTKITLGQTFLKLKRGWQRHVASLGPRCLFQEALATAVERQSTDTN